MDCYTILDERDKMGMFWKNIKWTFFICRRDCFCFVIKILTIASSYYNGKSLAFNYFKLSLHEDLLSFLYIRILRGCDPQPPQQVYEPYLLLFFRAVHIHPDDLIDPLLRRKIVS